MDDAETERKLALLQTKGVVSVDDDKTATDTTPPPPPVPPSAKVTDATDATDADADVDDVDAEVEVVEEADATEKLGSNVGRNVGAGGEEGQVSGIAIGADDDDLSGDDLGEHVVEDDSSDEDEDVVVISRKDSNIQEQLSAKRTEARNKENKAYVRPQALAALDDMVGQSGEDKVAGGTSAVPAPPLPPGALASADPNTNKTAAEIAMADDLKKLRYSYTRTAFDIDVDNLESHPWRVGAADISEFFNYGFNETTWKEYCRDQLTIRADKGQGPPALLLAKRLAEAKAKNESLRLQEAAMQDKTLAPAAVADAGAAASAPAPTPTPAPAAAAAPAPAPAAATDMGIHGDTAYGAGGAPPAPNYGGPAQTQMQTQMHRNNSNNSDSTPSPAQQGPPNKMARREYDYGDRRERDRGGDRRDGRSRDNNNRDSRDRGGDRGGDRGRDRGRERDADGGGDRGGYKRDRDADGGGDRGGYKRDRDGERRGGGGRMH